ncbi:unnamed protein product, partial [Linum tenue]
RFPFQFFHFHLPLPDLFLENPQLEGERAYHRQQHPHHQSIYLHLPTLLPLIAALIAGSNPRFLRFAPPSETFLLQAQEPEGCISFPPAAFASIPGHLFLIPPSSIHSIEQESNFEISYDEHNDDSGEVLQ